jgi:hypothetical protein
MLPPSPSGTNPLTLDLDLWPASGVAPVDTEMDDAGVMDVCSMRGRRGWRAFAGVAGLGLLLAPAAAQAATVPAFTTGPAISGTGQVGEQLAATAVWTGDPKPTAAWTWQRCATQASACNAIAGATGVRYRVVAADVGAFLRVGVRVTNSAGYTTATSSPTAAVAPAPVATRTPTPIPTPTPTPTAAPIATPEPTVEPPAEPVAAPVAAPVVVASTSAPLIPLAFDPFPTVRIKGLLTATGARVTLLTVRAPRDVRIDVDCKGRGCPARHYAPPAGTHRLRKFERDLKAGTRLEIRVTKPGYVGKFTSITIRRRAEPSRSDRCLDPGATRPVKCAAG